MYHPFHPPIKVNIHTMTLMLDPDFAKLVAPFQSSLPAPPNLDVNDIDGRRQFAAQIISNLDAKNPQQPTVQISQHATLSTDNHEIPIYRFHSPEQSNATNPLPAILHIHGGGMIMGDVLSQKHALSNQVISYGMQIFSVEYRLAPENRHPTLVEDCYAALLYLHANASTFNIDPARIAILGESAGGGLAAAVALLARDRTLSPPLAKQILFYPMLDDRNTIPNPAIEPFAVWKAADNATAWKAVLGDEAGTEGVSIYAAPARAVDLAGLPPTYMDIGGVDIFRDENMQYAARLAAANVPLEFHLYPGLPHGFENVSVGVCVTDRALVNRRLAVRRLLDSDE
ncbi:Alpha/Beta hydrolase protein [Aspergillus californicus]